jgi:hypothetical protein
MIVRIAVKCHSNPVLAEFQIADKRVKYINIIIYLPEETRKNRGYRAGLLVLIEKTWFLRGDSSLPCRHFMYNDALH